MWKQEEEPEEFEGEESDEIPNEAGGALAPGIGDVAEEIIVVEERSRNSHLEI